MPSSSDNINYAHESGINSVAGAIVFAVLYGLLMPYYTWRVIYNPTYVLILLVVFCAIRITAFTMRAVLAGSDTAGTNVGLLIGESIVYSVGFFGLLYSAYTLVLDREYMSGVVVRNPLSRITSNRHLIRLALIAAVAVGIAGSTLYSSSKPGDLSLSNTLRKVSAIIFLVVTALLVIHTALLVREEHAAHRSGSLQRGSNGPKHGAYVLCAIVILLLIREIYLTATIGNISHQNEATWYPLAALPEFLAVVLFGVPGLVPRKGDMIARAHGQEKDLEATELA